MKKETKEIKAVLIGLIVFGLLQIINKSHAQCNLSVNLGPCQTTYIGYGSNCVNLTATVTGGTAPFTYQWTPDQGPTATIQDCPVANKQYSVIVTDANGCTATAINNVAVYDLRCGNGLDKILVCHGGKLSCVSQNTLQNHLNHGDKLGTCSPNPCINNGAKMSAFFEDISDIGEFSMNISPNPALNFVNLNIENTPAGKGQLELLDFTGKVIDKKLLELTEGTNKVNLNIEKLNKGNFIIRVKDSNDKYLVSKISKL